MIKILLKKKALSIIPADSMGYEVLNKPLHKIYLRGTLGIKYDQELNRWQIDVGKKNSNILQKLIWYFNKYEITYE